MAGSHPVLQAPGAPARGVLGGLGMGRGFQEAAWGGEGEPRRRRCRRRLGGLPSSLSDPRAPDGGPPPWLSPLPSLPLVLAGDLELQGSPRWGGAGRALAPQNREVVRLQPLFIPTAWLPPGIGP